MGDQKMIPAMVREETAKDGVCRRFVVSRDEDKWFVSLETRWTEDSAWVVTRLALTIDGLNLLTAVLIDAQHGLPPSLTEA